ncbi:hypothetical protein VQ045_01645 [Aurantimonas sp. E1-2-R+4]|uniref:hypothetical protein n=1 Tax=Aurantimonas sp. E1-2-R+4 TaxID=3113714 RepID=UPI002F931C47
MDNLPDNRKRGAATVSRSRRAFLRGVSGSGLVVGALVVGADAGAEETLSDGGEEGYRENAHIRRFYELSRF